MATPKSIVRTDVVGVIGDSISSGFGSTAGWMFNFMPSTKAQTFAQSSGVYPLRQPVGYQAQTFPSFIIDAVPGRKCGDISGSMASTLAPFNAVRTNVFIVQLGTNDASATVAAATFNPQVTAIRDAVRAAPFFKMLIWIGPGFVGEKFPDGANAFDTVTDGIRDKDTALLSLTQTAFPADTYYVSWRTCRINAETTKNNPQNAASGIYTSDGTHPTSAPSNPLVLSGDNLLSSFTVPLLTYA
jgi:lysophospholipase L1-like esterase